LLNGKKQDATPLVFKDTIHDLVYCEVVIPKLIPLQTDELNKIRIYDKSYKDIKDIPIYNPIGSLGEIKMFNLPRQLYVLMFATFTNYIGFVVPMFLSLYLHQDGQPLSVIGYVLTTYGIGGFIGGFVGGYLSDKHSPYSIIMGSLLISISALLLIYTSNNMTLWLILLLCFGFADHAFRPAFTMLLVNNTQPEKRTFVFSLRNAVMNTSIGLAAVIGASIFEYDMKAIFLFDAIVNIVTLVLLLLFCKKLNEKSTLPIKMEAGTEKPLSKPFPKSMLFLLLSAFMILNVIVFSQFKITFPIYLEETFDFNAQTISSVYLLNTIMVILIEVPLIAMIAKYHQRKIMLVGSSAMCFGFALIVSSSHFYIPFIAVAIWTLGEMLFFPIILNEFIKTSTAHRGKVIGWHQTLFATGSLLGAPLGIYLYQFNNGEWLWIFCGLIGVFSLLALLYTSSFMLQSTE